MWSGVIVLLEPMIDDNLGLLRRREPFRIKKVPASDPIEPHVVSIFPGRSRVDAYRPESRRRQPCIASAANSGALSDRMYSGKPCFSNTG